MNDANIFEPPVVFCDGGGSLCRRGITPTRTLTGATDPRDRHAD